MEILPAFPVPSIFDKSIFFSSTIFLTEGDKFSFVFGGIYLSSFKVSGSSATKVSKISASLGFSSLDSFVRVKVSLLSKAIFLFFFVFVLSCVFGGI